jgi:hypothetical protein
MGSTFKIGTNSFRSMLLFASASIVSNSASVSYDLGTEKDFDDLPESLMRIIVGKTFRRSPDRISKYHITYYCLTLGGSKPSPLGDGFSRFCCCAKVAASRHQSVRGEAQEAEDTHE